MQGSAGNEEEIIRHIISKGCAVSELPNGYKVEYHGKSNIEWQLVLLYMSSLDDYSTSIISPTSAFLFRIG